MYIYNTKPAAGRVFYHGRGNEKPLPVIEMIKT